VSKNFEQSDNKQQPREGNYSFYQGWNILKQLLDSVLKHSHLVDQDDVLQQTQVIHLYTSCGSCSQWAKSPKKHYWYKTVVCVDIILSILRTQDNMALYFELTKTHSSDCFYWRFFSLGCITKEI